MSTEETPPTEHATDADQLAQSIELRQAREENQALRAENAQLRAKLAATERRMHRPVADLAVHREQPSPEHTTDVDVVPDPNPWPVGQTFDLPK